MPNISPLQNTPVLPNIRRIVTRPSGASCSRRNSAKLSLATIFRPLSWSGGTICSQINGSCVQNNGTSRSVAKLRRHLVHEQTQAVRRGLMLHRPEPEGRDHAADVELVDFADCFSDRRR